MMYINNDQQIQLSDLSGIAPLGNSNVICLLDDHMMAQSLIQFYTIYKLCCFCFAYRSYIFKD